MWDLHIQLFPVLSYGLFVSIETVVRFPTLVPYYFHYYHQCGVLFTAVSVALLWLKLGLHTSGKCSILSRLTPCLLSPCFFPYWFHSCLALVWLVCWLVFFFFKMESSYVAQGSLELEILLSKPPKCWDYMIYATTTPPSLSFIFNNSNLISLFSCPSR